MFTTAQFRVFAGQPEERMLSRPRHLLRDGDVTEAEAAYREVLETDPSLKAAWAEYFQLLRVEGRFDDALELAERAGRNFDDDAFAGALRGAALVEMGRLKEALSWLQRSAERDPDFGMVWHELGYAAWRLGESSRALLALDRAFALEPRSGTLHLRGKILRQAGNFMGAEVAFAGAAEAAEFPEQKVEAERQIGITRRYAWFGRRPAALGPPQRWFAEHGGTVLARPNGTPRDEVGLVEDLGALVARAGWKFTVVCAGDDWSGWHPLAARLGVPLVHQLQPAFAMVPLVVARTPEPGQARWQHGVRAVQATRAGLVFVLDQPADQDPVDLAGMLSSEPGATDLDAALAEANHPESRLAGRKLGTPA